MIYKRTEKIKIGILIIIMLGSIFFLLPELIKQEVLIPPRNAELSKNAQMYIVTDKEVYIFNSSQYESESTNSIWYKKVRYVFNLTPMFTKINAADIKDINKQIYAPSLLHKSQSFHYVYITYSNNAFWLVPYNSKELDPLHNRFIGYTYNKNILYIDFVKNERIITYDFTTDDYMKNVEYITKNFRRYYKRYLGIPDTTTGSSGTIIWRFNTDSKIRVGYVEIIGFARANASLRVFISKDGIKWHEIGTISTPEKTMKIYSAFGDNILGTSNVWIKIEAVEGPLCIRPDLRKQGNIINAVGIDKLKVAMYGNNISSNILESTFYKARPKSLYIDLLVATSNTERAELIINILQKQPKEIVAAVILLFLVFIRKIKR